MRMSIKARERGELESESVIEDRIPPAVPIGVEIVDLRMDSLLREIEIKVTNNAAKPIYFLELGIVLPDNLSEAGYPIGFPLLYGRLELIKLEAPKDGDVPLQPGESVVLKIPRTNLTGFEKLAKKGKISQVEIKRACLMFRGLTFGDKTGFSSDGTVVPYIRKARSANDCYTRRAFGCGAANFVAGEVLSGRVSASVKSLLPSLTTCHALRFR